MKFLLILITIILLIPLVYADVAIVSPMEAEVNESGLNVVAHGDYWTFTSSNAPGDSEQVRLWLFGHSGLGSPIYGAEFPASSGSYTISIDKTDLWSMEAGVYDFWLQFPGRNTIPEVEINSRGEIGSPWHYIRNVSVAGYDPGTVKIKLEQFLTDNPQLDDEWIIDGRVRIEEPNIRINHQYETSKGHLFIGGITNLMAGNLITATIDEDEVKGTYKERLFTTNGTVFGADPTQYRSWNMTFKNDNIGELRPGRHFVTFHLPTGQTGSTSFEVTPRVIIPTPTPEIIYSYGISGDLIGIDTESRYNYSEAHATPVPTAQYENSQKSVSEPYPDKLNDRVITQGMTVYIGETNVDIWAAVGWPNQSSGNWQIAHWAYGSDFYDLPDRIIEVKNPWYYNIDEETFTGAEGEWYQWEGWYEPKTPVAFVVKRLPSVNATPTVTTIVTTATPTPNVTATTSTVNATPVPTRTPAGEKTIKVPLASYLALLATAGVIYWRKR